MVFSPRKFTFYTLIFLFGVINIYSAVNKSIPANLLFANENLRNLIIQKNCFITQKVDPKDYLHNVIQVKLKNDTEIALLAKKQFGDYFNQIIKTEMIKTIESPFKKYFPGMLQAKDKRGLGRIYEIRFNNDIDPYQISKNLMANPNIEYATPIFKRYTNGFTPNDPALSMQYAMTNMHMEDAWDISKGDSNIVIAIIDSGTDWTHEDLSANIWINPKEIPENGIDDDHNGKIDDYHGWDFIGDITINDFYSGNWIEDNNPSNSGNDHGTFTAGCASAVTNNALGIAGTGFNCKIMPLKCAADNTELAGSIVRGYEAILFAAQNGADIINCSWGGAGGSPAEQDVINAAADLGSVVVVSAGNEGQYSEEFKTYPANYDNVINVGASNSADAPASFSNYGNNITVYAPGQSIYSTKFNSKYTYEDGTSFSSPIVAGIIGLMKAIHKDWTPMQFLRQIRSTSDRNMTNTAGYEQYFIGRVNAFKALTYNNPDYPDKVMPGIYGENLQVENSLKKLNNFDKIKISFDLKNYIGIANNLKISFSPIDKYIDNTTKEIILNNPLGINEISTIEFEVQLLPNLPWYNGTAQIMLKYECGDYIDYQVLSIPILMPTGNIFDKRSEYSKDLTIQFSSGSMPDKNTVWLIGNSDIIGGAFLYRKSKTEYSKVISAEPIYCIHGFDGNKAIAAASPKSGLSKIYYTTNGGLNWTTKLIDTITPFVNTFHFYNDTDGILLGDPLANVWGIANTTDAGNTWTLMNNIPAPLPTETGFVESVAFLGNNIWFGTSLGRIYYSNDKGENWKVSSSSLGNSLSKMTFLTDSIGYAVYSVGTGNSAKQFLGVTLDGGNTWTPGIYEFTKNLMFVAEIHAVPDAKKVIILTSDNSVFESQDFGTSWQPVLTKKMYYVNYGIALNDGLNTRLWSAGMTGIGFLDFKLTPATITKRIAVISENPLNFGDLTINTQKINRVEIRNCGYGDLKMESVDLVLGNNVEASEIRMMSQPAFNLKPLQSTVFNAVFKPSTVGIKTASIIINSDAEPNDLEILLIGNGISTTTVDELSRNSTTITLSPLPAGDILNIDYASENEGKYTIDIFDISGNRLIEIPVELVNGNNKFSVDIKNLTSGTYILTIKNGNKLETKKFVK
jgi:subtilisin family serine protease/photosystem II stability/assembly factor-like uncharacterized protein